MLCPAATELVDQDQGRRALHLIGIHGLGQDAVAALGIDSDWEIKAVFMQKCLQGDTAALGLVMFEHGVQADYHDIFRGEGGGDAARLRQTVTDAAGAEHLERLEHDDPAFQSLQTQCLRRIEPVGYLPWRCGSEFHIGPRRERAAPTQQRQGTGDRITPAAGRFVSAGRRP